MSEFSKLTIDSVTYDVKDNESRTNLTNLRNYYTSETRIGTWINNKPLYRQVIETTTPSSLNPTSIGSITNLGVMVNCYGFLTYNAQQVPLMFSYSNTVLNALLVDGTDIFCKLSANAYTSCSCFIVCEYTKSTD